MREVFANGAWGCKHGEEKHIYLDVSVNSENTRASKKLIGDIKTSVI